MNLKALNEKRNALVEQVNALFVGVEAETRAFTDEESANYDALMAEIKALDDTITRASQVAKTIVLEDSEPTPATGTGDVETQEQLEERAFDKYVREQRADANVTMGDNGAIIPTTIANRIVTRVREMCPIFSLATQFNVAGKLEFPVYDATNLTVGYQKEFVEMESKTGAFTNVELNGYLAGVLVKVSKSLINNSQINIVEFLVSQIADKVAQFLEVELIKGTGTNAISGVIKNTDVAKVTYTGNQLVDALIDAQLKIPVQYQGACKWLMNTKTLGELRKVKTTPGEYLIMQDLTQDGGYTLLGKPIMLSDSMPTTDTTDPSVVYGDFSGIYVNTHENTSVEILTEKYSTEHAVGVVTWLEVDAKVVETQKLVLVAKGTGV